MRGPSGMHVFAKFSLIFLLFLGGFSVNAQYQEVGLGFGGLTYTGDITRYYEIKDNSPGIYGLFRRNVSEAISLRANVLGGKIRGNERYIPDAFSERRSHSFNINIIETSFLMEYNFLDFRDDKALFDGSPFLFVGVGGMYFWGHEEANGNYNDFQLVLPFGGGYKHQFSPNFILGIEFGVRKTFTDYLDNLSGIPEDQTQAFKGNFEHGNKYNTDWYYFLGISINYGFFIIPCPHNYN